MSCINLKTVSNGSVELITICTGRPPNAPGSGGGLNAWARTPTMLLSFPCSIGSIWDSETVRSSQAFSTIAENIVFCPRKPLIMKVASV